MPGAKLNLSGPETWVTECMWTRSRCSVAEAAMPPLSGHSGTQLPVSRQDGRRHQLRPPVSLSQENQLEHVFGRTGRRHQGSRRRHLARQLHGLRSRLYRFGGKNSAAPQQPLRAKSVTYVLGTFCYPCLRAGHLECGGQGRNRTADASLFRAALYQLSYLARDKINSSRRVTPVAVRRALFRWRVQLPRAGSRRENPW